MVNSFCSMQYCEYEFINQMAKNFLLQTMHSIMSKNQHFIAISLGSNMGNRYNNLIQGVAKLKKNMHIQKVSSSYLTSPLGYLKQKNFINVCLIGTTTLSSIDFLKKSKRIEKEITTSKMFSKDLGD